MSEPYPVAERIVRGEEQLGLAGDPGFAANAGADCSIGVCFDAAFEDGSENSLLPPDVTDGEFAFCVEASHLCAGSCARLGGHEDPVRVVSFQLRFAAGRTSPTSPSSPDPLPPTS